MDNNYLCNIVRKRLSEKRFNHSLRVVETALKMAEGLKVDKEKTHVASLLHDYAKNMSPEELLSIARRNQLISSWVEERQPGLLHGPVAAYLCKKEHGIEDEGILRAIRFHTTGCENMTTLDKIVYLADVIEPGRTYEGVDELRDICKHDINRGLLFAFDRTIGYVIKRRMLIHPFTVEARNWIITEIERGGML